MSSMVVSLVLFDQIDVEPVEEVTVDRSLLVVDLVHDAVLTDPDPPIACRTRQFHAADRPGLVGQGDDCLERRGEHRSG